jgi:hypothetical protein
MCERNRSRKNHWRRIPPGPVVSCCSTEKAARDPAGETNINGYRALSKGGESSYICSKTFDHSEVVVKKKLIEMMLVSCLIACLHLLFSGCGDKPVEPKVKMNPNLKFLTRGHDIYIFEGQSSAEFPNWSPDGSKIYYLNVIGIWQGGFTYEVKQIRQIDTSGTNDVVLFEGNYIYLTLSPDCTTFATDIYEQISHAFPGGRPVLIDIATGTIDTLDIDTSLRVGPLEFTPSGDSLIYYAMYIDSVNGSALTYYYWGAFYAYDLSTDSSHFLFTENPFLVSGLAITPDGKKIVTAGTIRSIDNPSDVKELHNVGIWQTLSPSGDSVIGGFGDSPVRATYVSLTHLDSDSLIKNLWLIETETPTYVYSEFRFSPDGRSLALCIAGILSEGSGNDYSHNAIYLLTNFD